GRGGAMSRCRRCSPVPEEVRRAADLLERRWTLSVLYASLSGAERFNEFRQALGPVPPGTLAARLAELAEAGLLERRLVDARPPRAEYRLTTRGRELARLGARSRDRSESTAPASATSAPSTNSEAMPSGSDQLPMSSVACGRPAV